MPSRPYSVRFGHGRGATVATDYVVPAGYRAVVRYVSFQCFAGTTNYATLRVGGVPVVYFDRPASLASLRVDGRWVAYAGEHVEIVAQGEDVAFHASGFLLSDPLGDRRARAAAQHEAAPAAA